MEPLTKEQLIRVLPYKAHAHINPQLLDDINGLLMEEHERIVFRDNLLGYARVMANGRYKLKDYIRAIKFVSHKMLGDTNITSYAKTFPDRYQNLLNSGKDDNTISSFVANYANGAMVTQILEQALVPHHIMFQDIYQKAVATQAELMITAKSEKVRCDAANSLMVHLKTPETQKIELDIGMKESPAIADLRNATMELVKAQKQSLEAGASSAQEIAHSKIIEAEVINQ